MIPIATKTPCSVEVPLLPLTPKTRIPIAYMILPEKSSGISLSCQTLRRSPSCPLFRRSSTCSLCHFHIPPLSDHSSSIPASEKSASHGKLHGDTLSNHNPSVGITQIRYGRRSIFLSACHTSSRWLFSFLFFNIAHTYPVVKPPLLIALCTPAGDVTVHSVLSNTLRDAQNLC